MASRAGSATALMGRYNVRYTAESWTCFSCAAPMSTALQPAEFPLVLEKDKPCCSNVLEAVGSNRRIFPPQYSE